MNAINSQYYLKILPSLSQMIRGYVEMINKPILD
jgi:hypothetical protein